jgi:hypothetical protein
LNCTRQNTIKISHSSAIARAGGYGYGFGHSGVGILRTVLIIDLILVLLGRL